MCDWKWTQISLEICVHFSFSKNIPAQAQKVGSEIKPPKITKFEPYKGKIRKSGTGGIYQIGEHLFEGRYIPTNALGKREVHTVYAKTREECEGLLEKMIVEAGED